MILCNRIFLRILICLGATLFFLSCASSPSRVERGNSVAVWDLDDVTLSTAVPPDLGEVLSGQIAETLTKRGYVVVERQRLLLILKELHLGTTQLVDPSTRLKLGRMLGARWMVFGGYQIIGDQIRIDLRRVEVETGKIKKAVEKTTSATDLQGWIDATRKAAEEL